MSLGPYSSVSVSRSPSNVFTITLQNLPENRLDATLANDWMKAIRDIEKEVGPGNEGAIVTQGADDRFWCTVSWILLVFAISVPPYFSILVISPFPTTQLKPTNPLQGVDLTQPSTQTLYPLLHTLLDTPLPTVAVLTGHVVGGGVLLALAHDYRVMNAARGWIRMPPVDLGLHFPGMGALLRSKLAPHVARSMLLEARRWSPAEARDAGVVDELVEREGLRARGVELARGVAPKARRGVWALLRGELLEGEAVEGFARISWRNREGWKGAKL